MEALPNQILMGASGKWLEIEMGDKKFVGVVSILNSEGHEPMTIVARSITAREVYRTIMLLSI